MPVDFASWIRCLAGVNGAVKKNYMFLEKYELAGLLTLSPFESADIRRQTPFRREEWCIEALHEWRGLKRFFSFVNK